MNSYYEDHAKDFFEATVYADMGAHYKPFLEKLTKSAHILDAGCGSGRDSLNFINLGYKVTAFDASQKLCSLAQEHIGQEVLHMRFQEMTFEDVFDGIWASASLLHVPSEELTDVLQRLKKALKPTGVLYAGFKYGAFEGERNGRFFHDLTENKAKELFTPLGFTLEKMWITKDVRPERVDELWLNIIAVKS